MPCLTIHAVRAWLVVVLLAATAACQPLCSRAPSATGPTQSLTFTGPAAGTLTTGTTSCTVYPGQKQANFHVSSLLGDKQLELNIQVNGYTGPATYPVGSILDGAGEVRLQVADFNADSTTGAGTVTVNKDGKSGTLDVNLGNDEHVKGTFECDKVETG